MKYCLKYSGCDITLDKSMIMLQYKRTSDRKSTAYTVTPSLKCCNA